MRKVLSTICLAFVLGLAPAASLKAGVQAATDESLFREAKLLVFDKSFGAALDKINELIDRFPSSPLAGQALFYKGECLEGLGGRAREALRAYKGYIRLEDAKPSLVEESEGSIIDLAFGLYEAGDDSALAEIEDRLDHPNKVVRYYAAYKLSFAPDKKEAAKAAPILAKIVQTEEDPELLDRARIALMRVAPERLKAADERPRQPGSPLRLLNIRIRDGNKEVFSVAFPFALADLALSAMSEESKQAIRKKGYDVATIIDELVKSKTRILRIAGDDGSVIEIWID